MSKWWWVLIGLGVLLVASILFAYFFGVQAEYVWDVGRYARKDPAYWVKPVELRNLAATQSAGAKLTYLGYEFEVPWDDIDRGKSRVALPDKLAVILFRSGRVITVWRKPADELVSALRGDGSASPQQLAQVFGQHTMNSEYDFIRAILDVTPDDLGLFISRRQAIQKGTLLLMKVGVLHREAASGVFLFATPEFKGIQYGNPPLRPKYFEAELFNADAKLLIVFGNSRTGNANISQADANLVLRSIHEVSAQNSQIRQSLGFGEPELDTSKAEEHEH